MSVYNCPFNDVKHEYFATSIYLQHFILNMSSVILATQSLKKSCNMTSSLDLSIVT